MSIETSKKKKGIQMPHTYIILFLIVLVVCLLTYVIPAGQFERQEDASGRMLIVPGTYTQVESSPVSPLDCFFSYKLFFPNHLTRRKFIPRYKRLQI